MRSAFVEVLWWFEWFVLGYFALLNVIYITLIVLAVNVARRDQRRPRDTAHKDIFANPMTPAVSIVIPAFNEDQSIVDSSRAALELHYPRHEVVVVDDGSTDATFERLRAAFDLVEVAPDVSDEIPTNGAVRSVHVPAGDEPLIVVRKVNGGTRSDAVNAGLNAANHPLVCCVDADSILERDALLCVARPFVDDPDRVVATGGSIRAVNESVVYRGQVIEVRQPRSWIVRIQSIEYLRAFLLGRSGWSKAGGLLIISGAFGLFRRDLLVDLGGYDPESMGEDADLIGRIHHHLRDEGEDYRIEFVPDPVCWTEVPSTVSDLANQRERWSHGLAQVLWKQRGMLGRRRYGRIGSVTLPYYILFELFGPVIELLGIVALIAGLTLGIINTQFAILFALVALLWGVVVSVSSLVVEEIAYNRHSGWRGVVTGLAAATVENIGFRQMHAWWRIKGLVSAARDDHVGWGELSRSGFATESD